MPVQPPLLPPDSPLYVGVNLLPLLGAEPHPVQQHVQRLRLVLPLVRVQVLQP
eukprot:CAMPEP_0114115198 /NCGR_PEP_ID=MMETSP0043_2-20121206/3844_1 /TAXON_ID=464988 /ORGANISM="Hemiselmis andersenii, Strain CCMP644" /LENGTH=52 /DNA_ID=CAMNT_0001207451 /DNA_START=113 /DNA_END=268 /DNA_ORIENTATION=+